MANSAISRAKKLYSDQYGKKESAARASGSSSNGGVVQRAKDLYKSSDTVQRVPIASRMQPANNLAQRDTVMSSAMNELMRQNGVTPRATVQTPRVTAQPAAPIYGARNTNEALRRLAEEASRQTAPANQTRRTQIQNREQFTQTVDPNRRNRILSMTDEELGDWAKDREAQKISDAHQARLDRMSAATNERNAVKQARINSTLQGMAADPERDRYIAEGDAQEFGPTLDLMARNGNADYATVYYSLPEEQRKAVSYLVAKNGMSDAMAYLDSVSAPILQQYSNEQIERSRQFAYEHPLAGAGLSIAQNTAGSLQSAPKALADLVNRELITGQNPDVNSTGYLLSRQGKASREGTTQRSTEDAQAFASTHINGIQNTLHSLGIDKSDEEIINGYGNVAGFLTGTGIDMANSMIAGYMGTSALMGLSAGTDAYIEALQDGADVENALLNGVLQGTFEGLFEKYTIGNLQAMQQIDNVATWKQLVKNVVKSSISNASEEFATEIADYAADAITMGDRSKYRQDMAEYTQRFLAEGYSREEAEHRAMQKALGRMFKDATMAGIGGALSGFGSTTLTGLGTKAANAWQGRNVTSENLLNLADINTGDQAYTVNGQQLTEEQQQAKDTQDKLLDLAVRMEEGKKVSKSERGAAVREAIEARRTNQAVAMTQAYNETIQKAAEEGLGENGKAAIREISPDRLADAYGSFDAVYNSGRFNRELSEDVKARAREVLTDQEYLAAFNAGARDANALFPQQTVEGLKKATDKVRIAGAKGNVDTSGINYKGLTSQQKLRVDFYGNLLSKAMGLDVRFVQSDVVNGAYKGINGSYSTINGRPTITLDVNAGMMNESDWTGDITDMKKMLPTVAHEMTHWFEQSAPTEYRQLANAVVDALIKSGNYAQGLSFNQVLAAERSRLDRAVKKATGRDVKHTDVDAMHEIVARSCEEMLNGNEQVMEMFQSLDAQTKKSLLDHVNEIFGKIKEFFRQMLTGYESNSPEAQALREGQANLDQLQQLWNQALAVASETVPAADVAPSTETSVPADSTMGEFSLRQFAQSLDYDLEINSDGYPFRIIDPKTGKPVTRVTANQIKQTSLGYLVQAAVDNGSIDEATANAQRKMFADLMNLTLKYDDASLPMVWEVAGSYLFSSVKTNSDAQYSTTVDYGTICAKTQALIDVLSNTMVEKGRGLTRDEVITAYNMTANQGLSVPCPVCYVFSRWMGVPSLLETMRVCQERFGNASEAEIQKYIKDMTATYGDAKAINKEKTKVQNRMAALERNLQQAVANNDAAAQESIRKETEDLQKRLSDLESFNWVTQVRCKANKNGGYTLNPRYKSVPNDILLDLRRSGDFAKQYPDSWKYRTTRGAGMGKAIMPYSGASLGDFIKGTKDRWTEGKNPFIGKNEKASRAAVKRAIQRAKAQNLIGGQRFQSTSDFRAEWGIDYLMTFLECQAASSQVQLYTKVIEAVDLFATAGAETNLSIMPLDNGYITKRNGKKELVFSDVTGINFNEAIKKTRKYDNVQMILVGINDEHIRLAMADDRISFIIPWHSSGNSKDTLSQLMSAVGENLDVEQNTDYSETQTDKIIDNSDHAKALRQLRKDILQGKIKTLSAEQQSLLNENAWLQDLYNRFYVDETAQEYHVKLNGKQSESIFPYEYWDKSLTVKDADENGRRFQEYCASLGIQPRFSQFANDTGYWKLLIDRRMYNNDGTYHAPSAINVTNVKISNVPMAVNSNNYQDMSKINQATMDTLMALDNAQNDLQTAEVGEGIEEYSLRDSAGRELSEAQAEYFKDSKVRDDSGALQTMFHGTGNDFNIFDPRKLGGKNGTAEGYGIYLADRKSVSDAYGGRVIEAYVNVTKPATSYEQNLRKSELKKLIQATCEAEAQQFVDDGEYDSVKDAIKDTWISNYTQTYEKPMAANYEDVANQILRMNDNDMDIIQEIMNGIGIRSYESAYDFYGILKNTTGVDGFITYWNNSDNENDPAKIVVAFDSNQIKNVDNQNPTESDDIRYSLRTAETGYGFVEVDTDTSELDGLRGQKLCNKVEEIINTLFSGHVLGQKDGTPVIETRRGANEFANSERRQLGTERKKAKFAASKQLDELLNAAYYLDHKTPAELKEEGEHPEAVNGLDHYEVFFKVGENYFKGIATILNQRSVRTFYDVTRIKNINANDIRPSREGGHPPKDVLDYYIAHPNPEINTSDLIRQNVTFENRDSVDAPDQEYSLRTGPAPKETTDIYKLMRLDPDGKLRALFIDANGPSYELGQWYNADAPDISALDDAEVGYSYLIKDNKIISRKPLNVQYGKGGTRLSGLPGKSQIDMASRNGGRWMALFEGKNGNRSIHNVGINGSGTVSTFAYRPGIHAGSLPSMQQIGKGPGRNIRDDRFVWVKGKIAYDAATQEEANRKGGEINDRMPEGGYKYRTNSQADDRIGWYISGAFLPERIISDVEADRVVQEYNRKNGTNIPLDHRRENGRVFNAETMQLEDAPAQNQERSVDLDEAIERQAEKYGTELYREWKAKDRLKRKERYAMNELLMRARKLSKTAKKGSPAFQVQVDELIGDLDLVAKGIRQSTMEKLLNIQQQVDEQSEADPFYKQYEAPKYEQLLKRIRNQKISEMDLDDVVQLTESIIALEHSKKTADREIREKNAETFARQGSRFVAQQKNVKGVNRGAWMAPITKYTLKMLNPVRALAMMDGYQTDGVLTRHAKELNDGQTKASMFKMHVDKMFHDIDQNRELVRDFAKQNIEINTLEGKKQISKGMRIALYLHLQNNDNLDHIAYGGLTIPDEKLYRKGKYQEAYNKGETVHLAPWTETGRADTAKAIKQITDQMTEGELEYARIAQEFFNKVSKYAINETSMALDGYEKAIVDKYFPIRSNPNFTQQDMSGLMQNGTIEGMGMLKERTGRGKNPILLEDVAQVVMRQKNNVAAYYGLAIPIRNFNRFYNYTSTGYQGSAKDAVAKTWNTTGLDYIKNLTDDLQFGRQTQRTLLDRFKGLYAGTALNLNLGVAIKQSASYPFAASVIGWQPLVTGMRKTFSKADRDYMDSITPWGYMRRQGMSGTEMGEVFKQRSDIESNQTFQKWKSRLDWIRRVDVKTTEVLFAACEDYVRQQNPDLEVRGEEYNQKLAEVYNEVLQRTQPSYDVMQRNEFLRDNDAVTKIFGMFKTQTFNMGGEIIDAYGRMRATAEYAKTDESYRKAAADARKDFANTVAATIASQAMLAVLSAAANAVLHKMKPYRDEDGEVTPESIVAKIWSDFASSFAGMTMLGNEVQDLALALIGKKKWYDLDYPGLDLVNSIITASVNFSDALRKEIQTGRETGEWRGEQLDKASQKFAKLLMEAFKLKGIPTQNVYNIANAIYLWGQDFVNHELGTFNAGEGLLGITDTSVTQQQYAQQAVNAYASGDVAKGDKAAEKVSETQIQKALGVEADKDENGKTVTNSKKYNTIDEILTYPGSNEAKGKLFAAAYPSDALNEWTRKGKSAYDFMMGVKLNDDITAAEIDSDDQYTYVVEAKDYTPDQKVAWLLSNKNKTNSDKYQSWKSAGYTDWDYIKTRSDLSKFKGDDKQKKVIQYIKNQTSNEKKQRALWELAGYKDSTFDKKMK